MADTHIVFFSGGAASWWTAHRVAEEQDNEDMVLLFTDTSMEHPDLYRFLDEASEDVGAPLVKLQDGRTPWGVFFSERYLGNTRADPCSRILKRDLARSWIEENYNPESTVLYLGIAWDEMHRCEAIRKNWNPYPVEFPLCDPPYLTKPDLLAKMREQGIEVPEQYEQGFPHLNCGGFCVKAGQAHFKLLLETDPERYRFHEWKEQCLRAYLGADVAILRDRRGGTTDPMTLQTFRERLERTDGQQCDLLEWGGCGCFTDSAD